MTKHLNHPAERSWTRLQKRTKTYYQIFKKPIWGFIIVIVGVLIYKFVVPAIFFATFTPPPIPVSTEIAKQENWPKEIHVIGSLSAVNSVTLSAEVGGVINAIHFEPGQKVEKGAAIVSLNDDAEKADLKRYKSQLSLAEITLSRSEKLRKSDVESKANRDTKLARNEEMEAFVNQAQAIIEKKNITAPFVGVLGISQVNLGQYLQPGMAIVTLTDLDKLYINFNIAERFRNELATGQKINFQVETLGNKTFEGVITTIEPQINEETRNVSVQASYDNTDHKLSPGMFADVTVILPQEESIISVPETALDYGLYGSSIYIVEGEDPKALKVKRSFVKSGDRRKGQVAILSGIEAGQRVVTAGQLKLDNGTAVSLSEDKGPQMPDKLTNE